jgi:hypothetical protein
MPPNLKHPRHGLPRAHAVIGVSGHCRDIVSQYHTAILRRPFQDRRIVSPAEPDILRAHKIDRRLPTSNASHDIVIEILIGKEQQHRRSTPTPPGQKSISNPVRVTATLVLAADRVGKLLSAGQVSVHLALMPEEVPYDEMDVRQVKRRVLLHDGLRGHSIAVCGDDCIEGNAGASDTNHAIHVCHQRQRL